IDNKQYVTISEEDYTNFEKKEIKLSSDLVDFVTAADDQLFSICMGSNVSASEYLKQHFEGKFVSKVFPKNHLIQTALIYLKTPFGIDCSGFTQIVYKLNGYKLLRDASQQATQGEALSFIEESEPGDLAFFDNDEGKITHVGIIMKDNYIIHAHGKVRIDRLD